MASSRLATPNTGLIANDFGYYTGKSLKSGRVAQRHF